jgi:hypothetical protein
MKYLFAAACALALTLAASASHAQSKGGGFVKSVTTGTKAPPIAAPRQTGADYRQTGVLGKYQVCRTRFACRLEGHSH